MNCILLTFVVFYFSDRFGFADRFLVFGRVGFDRLRLFVDQETELVGGRRRNRKKKKANDSVRGRSQHGRRRKGSASLKRFIFRNAEFILFSFSGHAIPFSILMILRFPVMIAEFLFATFFLIHFLVLCSVFIKFSFERCILNSLGVGLGQS